MSYAELLRHRVDGTYTVDEWGHDPELVELLSPAFSLRWSISVAGAEHVPLDGPAVLVHNRRVGLSEPVVLSRGVRLATGRVVRPATAYDVAPLGTLLRHLGAVQERGDEIEGVLRHGALVALPLGRELHPRHRAGALRPEDLAPALRLDVPVLPVAVVGLEVGRRWRVRIGAPVERPVGHGPLAEAELAEAARLGVDALLRGGAADERQVA